MDTHRVVGRALHLREDFITLFDNEMRSPLYSMFNALSDAVEGSIVNPWTTPTNNELEQAGFNAQQLTAEPWWQNTVYNCRHLSVWRALVNWMQQVMVAHGRWGICDKTRDCLSPARPENISLKIMLRGTGAGAGGTTKTVKVVHAPALLPDFHDDSRSVCRLFLATSLARASLVWDHICRNDGQTSGSDMLRGNDFGFGLYLFEQQHLALDHAALSPKDNDRCLIFVFDVPLAKLRELPHVEYDAAESLALFQQGWNNNLHFPCSSSSSTDVKGKEDTAVQYVIGHISCLGGVRNNARQFVCLRSAVARLVYSHCTYVIVSNV